MANLSNINNKLLVGTNGEVRIGDTATVADVKLRVKQTVNQWAQQIVSTGGSYGLSIDTSSVSTNLAAGTLQLYTHSGGGFIVRNDSNVGIGTNSPDYKLEVESTSDADLVSIKSTAIANNTQMRLGISGNDSIISGTGGSVGNLVFKTYGSEKMRIDSSGRLSLGPDALDIQIDPASTNSGNNLIYMRGNASNDKSSLQMNHYGYADYYIGVGHVGNGKFNIANDLTGNDFVIDTSGSVGIGMDSPNANLQVNRNTSTANLFNFLDVVANFGNANSNPGNHYPSGIRIYQGSGTMGSGLAALNIGVDTNLATAVSQNTATIETPNGMTQGLRLSTRDSSAPIRFNTDSTERMRIHEGGSVTMGTFNTINAPNNGILKIRTSSSTAGTCYPLLSIMGSTHLATRQYGIGMDPEGYSNRVKMFFGVDGMGNGYSFGDFVWNINTQVGSDIVSPTDERMRLDKGGDLKLKTGSLLISNTSQGVYLGGTAVAHKLDFYKTGTWAPQIYYQNATDQANATNSTQTGIYTKIGNVCTVQFRLIWTQASGTPAVDNIGIKNLPFGGNTTQAYAEVPCSLIGYTGGPSPRGDLTLTLPGANQTLAIFNDTNNTGNMGNAIGSGTKEIRFSFTYLTN